ncbi:MAG: aspartyl protease family protein [Deltaproteobacteria bacterium]|nr:aspartyl protease family protein [Deltaproteobacteria bacterium]
MAVILLGLFFPGAGFADIYYWIDDGGIQNYSARLEDVPEQYRSRAQRLALQPTPPPPPELNPVPPGRGTTKIPFSPGSPILVQAKINGRGPFTLILDTGADATLVSPTVLSRLGLFSVNEPPIMVKGVTGTGPAHRVWVDFIEVGETRVGPLLIAVYEAALKGADGLLGRDFLSHFKVTIDSKEKVVTLTSD